MLLNQKNRYKYLLVIVFSFLLFSNLVEAKGKGKSLSKGVKVIKNLIASSKLNKVKARKIIRTNVPKNKLGLYKFKASDNKPYIGKSKNVQKRLIQHINSGKLHPKDVNHVSFSKKNIAKKDLDMIERNVIFASDKKTNGKLANKYHAPKSYSRIKRERLSKEIQEKGLYKTKF